jgi:hypothetical protein
MPPDLAAVGLVVHVGQDVQRLEDPAVVRERVTQLGRRAAGREDPENVVRGDGTGMDRRDDAQDVRPLALDARWVDLAARRGVQRPVVGAWVQAPELGVGQVGALRAVVEAQQRDEGEDDVAVGAGTRRAASAARPRQPPA